MGKALIKRKTGLAVLTWLALLGPAADAGTASMPMSWSRSAPAGLGDADADGLAADLSQIITGIGNARDVVVYRIALRSEERFQAAIPGGSAARPLQLVFNGTGSIAVLYPDIGEPYRGVFNRIIEGIEERTKARVASYAVGAQGSPQDLAGELRRQNVQVVIALGRNGLKAASGLDRDISVVVGGVLSVPEAEIRGMAVYSLAPDPGLLLERLKSLMPAVRRVFVVYDPRQNTWLVRLAREAARGYGIELVAQEATDLKAAMLLYQESMANADPKRDALWLPQDSVTVDELSVLPFVLQEAWNRALPVFSSNVNHVKRGALFSLYPNDVELGRSLAETALGRMSTGGQAIRPIVPLKDVLMAVNVRTASHLGLTVGVRQHQGFDMVFPEP